MEAKFFLVREVKNREKENILKLMVSVRTHDFVLMMHGEVMCVGVCVCG